MIFVLQNWDLVKDFQESQLNVVHSESCSLTENGAAYSFKNLPQSIFFQAKYKPQIVLKKNSYFQQKMPTFFTIIWLQTDIFVNYWFLLYPFQVHFESILDSKTEKSRQNCQKSAYEINCWNGLSVLFVDSFAGYSLITRHLCYFFLPDIAK